MAYRSSSYGGGEFYSGPSGLEALVGNALSTYKGIKDEKRQRQLEEDARARAEEDRQMALADRSRTRGLETLRLQDEGIRENPAEMGGGFARVPGASRQEQADVAANAGKVAADEQARALSATVGMFLSEPDPAKRRALIQEVGKRDPKMAADLADKAGLLKPQEVKAGPLTPWAKEGFPDEATYLRFKGREAGATRAPKEPKVVDPNIPFTVGNALRDDFNRLTEPYNLALTASRQMEGLAKVGTGSSDVALLTQAAKILDPKTAAREGEVAIQQTAASLADRMGVKISNLMAGEKLSPQQRRNLIETSKALMVTHRANYLRQRDQFGALAKKYKGDPWDAVGDDPEAEQPVAPGMPNAADVLRMPGQPTDQRRPPLRDFIGGMRRP